MVFYSYLPSSIGHQEKVCIVVVDGVNQRIEYFFFDRSPAEVIHEEQPLHIL
jgi:hypothetical protein